MTKAAPQPSAQTPLNARYDVLVTRTYIKDGDEQTSWTNVGVAFANKDGKGFNVTLHALPLDGKLVIRLHEERERD